MFSLFFPYIPIVFNWNFNGVAKQELKEYLNSSWTLCRSSVSLEVYKDCIWSFVGRTSSWAHYNQRIPNVSESKGKNIDIFIHIPWFQIPKTFIEPPW